jgi:hypothetical protein
MTGRTILSVAYGIHAKERDDYYISLAKQALDVVAKATEKGRLINLIPARMSSLEPSNSRSPVNDTVVYFPSWFPGAGFKREAESWARSMNAIVEEPFSYAKKAMVNADRTALRYKNHIDEVTE